MQYHYWIKHGVLQFIQLMAFGSATDHLDAACFIEVALVKGLLQLQQLLHHPFRHIPTPHTTK